MSKKLTISTIAKEIEISVETIRYYERIGLISQPKKPDSGYRIYNDEILKKLYFIKRAKMLGFSLNEISDILAIGNKGCKKTKEIASLKLQNVRNKINDLESISKTLEELIEACDSNTEYKGCPIFSAISKK
jgi:MerR family mercuric resistance operon transcriptional regulator